MQRSIELLDARITLSIQTQNRSVLDTISQTGRSQYRLQLTVEGLSIIAISYYALGILGYTVEGLHELVPFTKGEVLAIAAPIVVLLVFLAVRRIRETRALMQDIGKSLINAVARARSARCASGQCSCASNRRRGAVCRTSVGSLSG